MVGFPSLRRRRHLELEGSTMGADDTVATTSGLDPNQIADIRDLIRKIGKEKTVIL